MPIAFEQLTVEKAMTTALPVSSAIAIMCMIQDRVAHIRCVHKPTRDGSEEVQAAGRSVSTIQVS
jgi:hypothetical protein